MNSEEEDIFIQGTVIRYLYGIVNDLIFNPMKYQLVLFIFLFCCFSCASQKKEIIAKSTIKLEGRSTSIRDLMEIDGYYYMKEYPDCNCRMFFEDGIWVDFCFNSNVSEDKIKANLFKSLYEGRNKKIVGDFPGECTSFKMILL